MEAVAGDTHATRCAPVADNLQLSVGMYDVVIIGGGPAGLNAALLLGRARRRTVVCDAGAPRNAASHGLHGFLSRDGIAPADLLRIGRDEISRYGVEWRPVRVTAVTRTADTFDATLETGEHLQARKLLVATGVTDHLPEIDGFEACYGRSVHHCPYCDGWEWRDQPLAVFGHGKAGAALSLALLTWSTDVHLFSHGPCRVPPPLRRQLNAQRIEVHEEPIGALEHEDGLLGAVRLRHGGSVVRKALFFTTGQDQRESFARQLGCEFTRKGSVKTDRYGQTCVPGVFVVGDASFDVQFVIVAASEGAKAAVLINKQFQAEAGQALG
jgi:thioredoxin reductase